MAKIDIKNLHMSFGPKKILRGVDLSIEQGTSLVIIGGSGTGKSVLLKCILGLLSPQAGEISVDGADILKMNALRRFKITQQIGMLFQGGALFDSLRIWENVAFRLLYGRMSNSEKRPGKADAYAKALQCLRQVGLEESVAEQAPASLSGGMQKRVSLARAIAADPSILFFDEPTTGLDPIMADVINQLIISRVKALGATAITITHDLTSAQKIADEIAMLHEGKIIWRGTPDKIYQSDNPYVDQFVHGRAEGPISTGTAISVS